VKEKMITELKNSSYQLD